MAARRRSTGIVIGSARMTTRPQHTAAWVTSFPRTLRILLCMYALRSQNFTLSCDAIFWKELVVTTAARDAAGQLDRCPRFPRLGEWASALPLACAGTPAIAGSGWYVP